MTTQKTNSKEVIKSLIKKGGVYFNIKGDKPELIFKSILDTAEIPAGLSKDKLYQELCQREELMTTAVGNGIAIPHPRYPLFNDENEQRLIVCFLDKPVMMNPPDMKPIYVYFMLLTSNTKTHLMVLSQLAFLFQKPAFRQILEKKPTENELLEAIDNCLAP